MNVGQLREILSEHSDETIVVMSSDAEGNSYSPLAGVGRMKYLAESTYSGIVYDAEELASEIKDGWLDQEEADELVDAVTLWPTN
jgi:hypothetical protein